MFGPHQLETENLDKNCGKLYNISAWRLGPVMQKSEPLYFFIERGPFFVDAGRINKVGE